MILRPKYSEAVVVKIPETTRLNYESAFNKIDKPTVRVINNNNVSKQHTPCYYLNTEITKYKPGSPIGRFLLTPAIAFGLWGSYVNVDFNISDPSTGAVLGTGMIRKANQWGGIVGLMITSETQLEACPQEIMDDLNSVMNKKK